VNIENNSLIEESGEFLTFTGEYEHTLDSQRRISIPTCWREKGKDNIFFLLPGRHGALQIIPYVSFKELLLKARKVSFADSSASLALARLGSMAQECKCDKQGRIPIPQRLLDYGGLGDVAVMVGALTSIQIWAPENWAKYRATDESVLDEIQKIGEKSESIMELLKR
jgi:MraZ protein